MQIALNQLLPKPLAEQFAINPPEKPSEIWQNEMVFEQGKKYLVYATSGKGKSTFIHILYGLRQDFLGKFQIQNANISKDKRMDWALLRQKHLSIVFQDLRLFLHLTAYENILIKAILQKEDLSSEIKAMAQDFGIAHVLHRKAETLSYGERQRTAIIRSLVQPFDFILLDEPFSHLDEINIRKASEWIESKRKENQAGLIMTSLGNDYGWQFDKKLLL